MSNRRGEDELPHKFMDLSPSARIITSYLQFESIINGKTYVTFNDIVENTGLSKRAVRSALEELRARGIVEAILDISRGRRYLYKLILRNILIAKEEVESGLYLIDIGVGVPNMMSFGVYRAMRASVVAYYTKHVPQSLLEYTRCTCSSLPLEETKPNQVAFVISKIMNSRESASIIYDQLLDWELVEPYIRAIEELGIKVKHLQSVSPLTLGIQLLMGMSSAQLNFKRGNISIRIIRTNTSKELKIPVRGLLLKAFEINKSSEGIEIKQLSDLSNLTTNGYDKVFIIYELIPEYPA